MDRVLDSHATVFLILGKGVGYGQGFYFGKDASKGMRISYVAKGYRKGLGFYF